MIKFIIGMISITLVSLISYMLINENEVSPSQNVVKQKTPNSMKEDSLLHGQERKLTSPKKREKLQNTLKSKNELGKNLTLEGIENSDVSDDTKERLRMDMLYYETTLQKVQLHLSEEEIQRMIINDFHENVVQ